MNTSSFASAINVSSNGISLIEFLYFTYFSPPGFHPRKKTKKTNDEQAKEQAVNWISLYSIIPSNQYAYVSNNICNSFRSCRCSSIVR